MAFDIIKVRCGGSFTFCVHHRRRGPQSNRRLKMKKVFNESCISINQDLNCFLDFWYCHNYLKNRENSFLRYSINFGNFKFLVVSFYILSEEEILKNRNIQQ